jgi:VWFA-related protein
MTFIRKAGLLGAILCSTFPASARQDPKPFETGTTAVVIDLVVRDARGRPVTDLRLADFELYEDGVRQEIGDVTRVGSAAGAPGAAGSTGAAGAVTPSASGRSRSGASAVVAPTFLALVFDRLTPEARALAHKGALAYLDTSHEGDFAGVFLSDLSLVPIQTYTNDRAKLREALRDVASRATSVFDREAIRDPTRLPTYSYGDAHPSVSVTAGAESVGRPVMELVTSAGSAAISGNLATPGGASAQTALTFERLARDQQGFASVTALRAVIEGLGVLPGRKTVVFFAEALAMPEAIMPQFEGLVALANRVNVSVYTMDAAGLRAHSSDAETGREIRAIGERSMVVGDDGSPGGTLVGMEHMSDVLRKDPRTSLTMLAERTGGFLIENTNDLGRGFRTIDIDRRFHYLLTYAPKNTDFRGEWRSVDVRVPGRKVQVRSRSGYPAVRSLSSIPLLAYEGPALAALEQPAPPAQIPLRATALQFPVAGGGTQVAVMVAANGQTLTFEKTADGFRTDFTLLARVRDASGAVVRKGSQPYRMTGPPAGLEKARAGDVLFYRQPTLEPGQYTLDAVVHDALNGKAGVTRVAVTVPAVASFRASDLVIVDRTERLMSGELDPDNPLQVSERQIYPTLGQPLRRTRTEHVAFYIVLDGADQTTSARLHVIRQGQTLAELPVPLQSPDAGGRIRQVSQIPAGGLGTGDFVLRLVVSKGTETVTRQASVRVEITG